MSVSFYPASILQQEKVEMRSLCRIACVGLTVLVPEVRGVSCPGDVTITQYITKSLPFQNTASDSASFGASFSTSTYSMMDCASYYTYLEADNDSTDVETSATSDSITTSMSPSEISGTSVDCAMYYTTV